MDDVVFAELRFANKSGARVAVSLEAPADSNSYLVKNEEVRGEDTRNFNFQASNIRAARIRAESIDGGAKDEQIIQTRCSPFNGFILSVSAEWLRTSR